MSAALSLIAEAAAYAAEAHQSQRRKTGDQPYINHLLRVSRDAARAGLGEHVIAAAVLHDVVEDTDVELDDLRPLFPQRVVELVNLMTQWWKDDAPAALKEAERPKYFARILRDEEAVALKLLDRADNLRDMARGVEQVRRWAERYHQRSLSEMADLRKACRNPIVQRIFDEALEASRSALAAEKR